MTCMMRSRRETSPFNSCAQPMKVQPGGMTSLNSPNISTMPTFDWVTQAYPQQEDIDDDDDDVNNTGRVGVFFVVFLF